MKFGSVCSGIEAASVAWEPLGWRAEFFAEIDGFPAAVLAHRFPGVPNRGDMTKFREWPDAAIDVFVGGTPCQSFSIAGLRRGLDDPRGNLALVYLGMVGRYRPRWVVWENVPGVLSSSGGRDFASFLGGLGQLGYGWAYRVLDAQHVRVQSHPRAVPQRRRRVFVVGHSSGDFRRAAAVLFEPEGMCGHPAPRREAGKDVAPTISARTKGGGGLGTDFDLYGGLVESCADVADTITAGANQCTGFTPSPGVIGYAPEIARCVATREGSSRDYETTTMVAGQTLDGGEIARTLSARHGSPCADRGPDIIAQTVAIRGREGGATAELGGEVATALRASQGGGDKPHVLAFDTYNQTTAETAATLRSGGGPEGVPAILTSAVRRLTPVECERLQGFPDNYTAIPWRGKPADQCPDGPRCKALGNSMAVNVMRWIGERIDIADRVFARLDRVEAAE